MARVLLTTTPWLPFHTLRGLFPEISPHGIQVLAGVLRAAGHEARVVDVQHLPPYPSRLVQAIRDFAPDVIGVTNNCLPNTPAILEVARRIRRDFPRVHLIAGGQVPSARPAFFVGGADPLFDAVGVGEGEGVIGPLVEALVAGADLAGVRGIAWPDGAGGVVASGSAPIIAHLEEQPLPAWEGSLKRAFFTPGLAAPLETTRGCPYRCSFCSIPGYFGKHPRHKSVERILAELQHLKAQGVTEVHVIDDSFATDLPRARALFEGMIRERLDLRFGIQIRADIVASNPDLIELAARAGLYLCVVGFEGYTSRVMAEAGKGSSREINEAASAILRRHGICVYGTHIFGGPGMRWTDNLATFLRGRRNADVFRMTIYTPLLGSRLYDELEAEGRIRTHDPRDYYYGTYIIEDGHNPQAVKLAYFGLLALHYALPDTWLKALAAGDPVVREFNRRAYRGASEFVAGTFWQKLKRKG